MKKVHSQEYSKIHCAHLINLVIQVPCTSSCNRHGKIIRLHLVRKKPQSCMTVPEFCDPRSGGGCLNCHASACDTKVTDEGRGGGCADVSHPPPPCPLLTDEEQLTDLDLRYLYKYLYCDTSEAAEELCQQTRTRPQHVPASIELLHPFRTGWPAWCPPCARWW
jgi:hypothetical protein